MPDSLKRELNSSLEAIAIKSSIKLDNGQLYVSEYFNNLLEEISQNPKKFIFKFFTKLELMIIFSPSSISLSIWKKRDFLDHRNL